MSNHSTVAAFSTPITRVDAESDVPKWQEMDASNPNHVLLDDVSGSKVVSGLEFHLLLFAVRPMDDSISTRSIRRVGASSRFHALRDSVWRGLVGDAGRCLTAYSKSVSGLVQRTKPPISAIASSRRDFASTNHKASITVMVAVPKAGSRGPTCQSRSSCHRAWRRQKCWPLTKVSDGARRGAPMRRRATSSTENCGRVLG
ncbi:hypothetical protein BKA58DRAFT_78100 [Alternaria rosae]|uniref:uncharacterized protein n=1 Tax=Alternaria rosae TaxID=1187941 RepID=UPI001E8E8F1B|nr:uncharacterized protein BKA58DRAFT_78100 [Alternaria rosae]KAH6877598.1 hypothetical protein BKA58DRAFT_78100 [Alternaria rosae]